MGVETLAIVASKAERARFFFRYRPVRCAVGADPELSTHSAYGVPQGGVTPEAIQAIAGAYGKIGRAHV